MMSGRNILAGGLMVAPMLAGAAFGCRKAEHRSVHTYEYRSEPPPPQPVYAPDPIERQKSNELDSEYKMISPGEMRGR